jgi:hypothetical protein
VQGQAAPNPFPRTLWTTQSWSSSNRLRHRGRHAPWASSTDSGRSTGTHRIDSNRPSFDRRPTLLLAIHRSSHTDFDPPCQSVSEPAPHARVSKRELLDSSRRCSLADACVNYLCRQARCDEASSQRDAGVLATDRRNTFPGPSRMDAVSEGSECAIRTGEWLDMRKKLSGRAFAAARGRNQALDAGDVLSGHGHRPYNWPIAAMLLVHPGTVPTLRTQGSPHPAYNLCESTAPARGRAWCPSISSEHEPRIVPTSHTTSGHSTGNVSLYPDHIRASANIYWTYRPPYS